MKVKTEDYSRVLKRYSSVWVAMEPDSTRVVAVGKDPATVLGKAKEKGVKHPVLTRVPKDYGVYIL